MPHNIRTPLLDLVSDLRGELEKFAVEGRPFGLNFGGGTGGHHRENFRHHHQVGWLIQRPENIFFCTTGEVSFLHTRREIRQNPPCLHTHNPLVVRNEVGWLIRGRGKLFGDDV